MITYGFSLQGKSHIKKKIVCQDSHRIEKLDGEWYVLVVADGVGSAVYSDCGSKVAVTAVVEYCKKNVHSEIKKSNLEIVLQEAYMHAFEEIEKNCQADKNRIEDYDTTLSAVLYDGRYIIFGHAGDGGIIIEDVSGKMEIITEPQKGKDGISVRPLRAGVSSWTFGRYEKEVHSVVLLTDGMLDIVTPALLNLNQVASKKKNVYVTLLEFFTNPYCVFLNKEIKEPNKFMEYFLEGNLPEEQFNDCLYKGYEKYLKRKSATTICQTVQKYNYSTWAVKKVEDDKTIVCAINEKKKYKQQKESYFIEPDWKQLQHQFEKMAYPSLFLDEQEKEKENDKKEISKHSTEQLYEKQRKIISANMGKYVNYFKRNYFFKIIIKIILLLVSGIGMLLIIG